MLVEPWTKLQFVVPVVEFWVPVLYKVIYPLLDAVEVCGGSRWISFAFVVACPAHMRRWWLFKFNKISDFAHQFLPIEAVSIHLIHTFSCCDIKLALA